VIGTQDAQNNVTQRKENKNSICNFNSTVVIMLLFQVSDFGFKLAAPEASLLDENRKQVPGACGYMAPEYLMDGNQFPPLSRLHTRLCSADE
jgi:hypothetical protein